MTALNLKEESEKQMEHRRNIANTLKEVIVHATVEEEIKDEGSVLYSQRGKKKKKKKVNLL